MKISKPSQLVSAAFAVSATLVPAFAESLPANASTSYSAVIHFDRIDYFVENRYGPTTPTQSAAKLETAIMFTQGAFMEPDANGHLNLPANFGDRVAFVKDASPDAKLTLGVFSLRHIVSKPTALQTFIGEPRGSSIPMVSRGLISTGKTCRTLEPMSAPRTTGRRSRRLPMSSVPRES